MARPIVEWVLRSSKRIAVTILGFGLVAGGIVLLVLPGPGLLVIIAGLAVLASEYAWARRALDEAKRRAKQASDKVRRRKDDDGGSQDGPAASPADPSV